MRTFTFLILVVNLACLVWGQVGPKDGGVEPVGAEERFFRPAGQSLVLLSELPPPAVLPESADEAESLTDETISINAGTVSENVVSTIATPVEVSEPELRCEVISGFSDQSEAEAFIADIGDKNVSGRLVLEQEQISSTWWVHLPPFPSQLKAQDLINELTAKGIDNFYMRTGELAGGISLGVFSREESATAAQSGLRSRGYETSIKEIPRYVSNAYVTLEESAPGSLTNDEWQTFWATKQGLETTEKLCETIAR